MPIVEKHATGSPTWVDLMTDAPEKAREFYGALFGWTFELGGPEFGGYATAFKEGKAVAGVGGKPKDAPYPNVWTVYFDTSDLEASVEKVRRLGGQVMQGPMEIGEAGRMSICADPTGAAFGLWQTKKFIGAERIDEPGAMAWREVNTREAQKARDFYAQLLGFEPKKMEGMSYWTLQDGPKAYAGIMQMDERWPQEVPPHWMNYFAVEDADAAVKRVAELGGKVQVPPFDTPYGRMSVVSDPGDAVFTVIALSELGKNL